MSIGHCACLAFFANWPCVSSFALSDMSRIGTPYRWYRSSSVWCASLLFLIGKFRLQQKSVAYTWLQLLPLVEVMVENNVLWYSAWLSLRYRRCRSPVGNRLLTPTAFPSNARTPLWVVALSVCSAASMPIPQLWARNSEFDAPGRLVVVAEILSCLNGSCRWSSVVIMNSCLGCPTGRSTDSPYWSTNHDSSCENIKEFGSQLGVSAVSSRYSREFAWGNMKLPHADSSVLGNLCPGWWSNDPPCLGEDCSALVSCSWWYHCAVIALDKAGYASSLWYR
jgi:hypothetical protein